MSRLAHVLIFAVVATACTVCADPDEFTIKRETDFAFAAEPTVTRDGDRVTIGFETKSLCDVTVAIEDAQGRIVRHLVSGVLGANAPAPLLKNSRKQTVLWDCKDDRGRYIDDLSRLTVRVSLGLHARYERALNAHPIKLPSYRANPGKVCAAPEGVYVFTTGAGVSFLRLFDHEGNYIRTVYPFPSEKIGAVRGLIRRRFPQTGKSYPAKWGLNQNTFLTGGHEEAGAGWPESTSGDPARTLAVRNGRIALIHQRVGRLASDGSSGGLDLIGPTTHFPLPMSRVHSFTGGTMRAYPRSAAFGPDGKVLYLAGYFYSNPWRLSVLHGVAKVDFTAGRDAKAKVFAGKMDRRGHGDAPDRFSFPAAVACDGQGRVYVADYLNDRIQIFTPEAKLLKTVNVSKPVDLAIHHRTGEIYVFSWYFRNDQLSRMQSEQQKKRQRILIPPKLIRLGPFENPQVRSTCELPVGAAPYGEFGHPGEYIDVTLDSWAEPATIWICRRGNWRGGNNEICFPQLYVERDGKLVLKRSFVKDVRRAVGRTLSARHGRVRVYCNPKDGKLYCGESHSLNAKSFSNLVRFDPETGRFDRIVELPFHSEDLAFGPNGECLLRTEDLLARYRLLGGGTQEVPFDYGVERDRVGYSPHASGRFSRVISGIELPSRKPGWWIMGGMAVSPKGNLAVACHNPGGDPSRRGQAVLGKLKRYKPRVYPGRPVGWEIHVWDKHGKLLHKDAIPGSRQMFGIGIDRNDDLYCLTPSQRILADGKPYPNDVSCTVFKARIGRTRFLSAGGGKTDVPVPLETRRPDRRPDIIHGLYAGKGWIEGAEWIYGGVGNAAKYIGRAGGGCWCQYAQMTLDRFARTFAPEPDIYAVAVLDSAGNLVLRIGRYGNADDGLPLAADSVPPGARPMGGDEVALFNPQHLATHTDRRLFISDIGNGRVVGVRLGYHATQRVKLSQE